MLTGFFYTLRQAGLKVGPQEWLALMQALAMGLHESEMTRFYNIARSLLVKSEAEYDRFDQVFAHYFKGVELKASAIHEEILEWLKDPMNQLDLSPEQLRALEHLDLDRLRELLEERLREQKEQHDGGNRWIGRGGTSPFGHSGQHPTGIRIGGMSMGRSAMQVAALRRYIGYRTDVILDVRQIKVALAKLRQLSREGSQEELDVEASIDATCKNAGELELVFRPPRKNNIRLILAMDVGGSMDPHARLLSRLFSAAHASKHLKAFHPFYFHNCIYDEVYEDASFTKPVSLDDLTAKHAPETKLVLVGDALMHPVELFQVGGASYYYQYNPTPGIECLRRLADHFHRAAWLNPERPQYWRHPTSRAIGELFHMFPLTIEGLDAAVAALIRGPERRPADPVAAAAAWR